MKKIFFLFVAAFSIYFVGAQTKADTTFDKVVTIAHVVSPNVHVDTLNSVSDLVAAVKELKDTAPKKGDGVDSIILYAFAVLGLVLGIIQCLLHHNLKKEFQNLKQAASK